MSNSDYEAITVSGSTLQEIASSLTVALQSLPPEMSRRLRTILKNYFGWYGAKAAYERLNNRTVAQIFAEYQPRDVRPLATGEVDGVRYELYEAPRRNRRDENPRDEK
jgi:hypothetical protein